MDYLSATKKNEILSFLGKWMKLKDILLNKISQTQKDNYCLLCLLGGNFFKNLKIKDKLLGTGKETSEEEERRRHERMEGRHDQCTMYACVEMSR